MIKSLTLLTRRAGLTHEEFMRHWVEIHAPLARKVPGIRRYVQTHLLEERKRPDIPSSDVEIDGVAELWYDDQEAMRKALASPEGKALYADGALFIGRVKTYTDVHYGGAADHLAVKGPAPLVAVPQPDEVALLMGRLAVFEGRAGVGEAPIVEVLELAALHRQLDPPLR